MDLSEYRRRLEELASKPGDKATLVRAMVRLETEMIRDALSRWRPLDGSEGDRSSLVPCPKKPRPTLNRAAAAVPLESDDGE